MRASIGSATKTPVGELRHRVRVERERLASDASGQQVPTPEARFTSEPSAYREVSGGETIRGRQVEAEVVAIFTVNYRDGYDTTDEIVFDGERYAIHRIHRVLGLKRFLDLHCKRRPI